LYEYNNNNFYNELYYLSDCISDKTCWLSKIKFDNLLGANLFSKQFYDNNIDIDFVFVIPSI
jgi:hypothetical protein